MGGGAAGRGGAHLFVQLSQPPRPGPVAQWSLYAPQRAADGLSAPYGPPKKKRHVWLASRAETSASPKSAALWSTPSYVAFSA